MSDDRVAIVSGGSGGIGAATCRALSTAGTTVLVGYARHPERAEEVAESCDGPAEPVAFDVTEPEQVEAAVEKAQERGELRILVYAAGITDDDLMVRLEPDSFDRTVEINLRGAYLATRAVLRPMLKSRWGRIVLLSSVVGWQGNPGQAAYGATKAGLVGLARSLVHEVSGKGITVNAVAPGFVETAMTADLPEEIRKRFVDESPIGRAVTAEEVAAAIRFLTSEEAGAITGAVLPVDGGFSA